MLLVHFLLSPAEGIEQLDGPHSIFACLQIVEDSLQAKWNRLVFIDLRWHMIDSSPEGFDDEKCLYQ